MVKLPDQNVLGEQRPVRAPYGSPPRLNLSAYGQGFKALGAGLEKLSAGLSAAQAMQSRKQAALNLAEAQAEYQIGSQRLLENPNADPADFGKVLGNAADNHIKDPYYRQLFIAKHAPTAEHAGFLLNQKQKLDQHDLQLQDLSENSIAHPENAESNLRTMKSLIESEQGLGLSRAQLRQRSQQWGEGLAKSIMENHLKQHPNEFLQEYQDWQKTLPKQPSTPGPRSDNAPETHYAAVRTNNPGAQWPSSQASRFGATSHEDLRDGNKIAVFPTPVHGAASNMDLLARSYVGMTIGAGQQKWSGSHRAGLPGWDSNQVITKDMVQSPDFMIPFMKSIANAETPNGANALNDQQWQSAFDMYSGKPTQVASRTDVTTDQTGAPPKEDSTGTQVAQDEPAAANGHKSGYLFDLVRPSVLQGLLTQAQASKVAQKQAADKRELEILQQVDAGNPAATLSTLEKDPELLQAGSAGREAIYRLRRVLQEKTSTAESTKASALASRDILGKMELPPGTPGRMTSDDIVRQMGPDGKLSLQDGKRLLDIAKQIQSPEGTTTAARVKKLVDAAEALYKGGDLTGGTGVDKINALNYEHMVWSKIADYQKNAAEYQKQGKTLDTLLSDPHAPDYIGRPTVINSFNTDWSEQLTRDQQGSAPIVRAPGQSGPDIKPMPGEAPSDFLRRLHAAPPQQTSQPEPGVSAPEPAAPATPVAPPAVQPPADLTPQVPISQ